MHLRTKTLRNLSQIAPSALNPFPRESLTHLKFENVLDAAAQKSHIDLTKLDYTPFLPVDFMQNLVLTFEQFLPFGGWPVAIAGAAVVARLIIAPIQIWSVKKSKENKNVMVEMADINKQLKKASTKGDTKMTGILQEKYNTIIAKHGRFFAFKGMVGTFIPIPMFMTTFATMRGFADHPTVFTNFALSDPLWLNSLALPDPYFVLPAISAGLFLTNLELTGRMDTGASTASSLAKSMKVGDSQIGDYLSEETMNKIKKYGLRSVVVGSLYFTTAFPAACFFFFIPNTVLAIVQNRLLKRQEVQRYLGLLPESLALEKGVSKSKKSSVDKLLDIQSKLKTPMKLDDFLKLKKQESDILGIKWNKLQHQKGVAV
jgi:YidC/Oxa1 family membrane protein insertase